MQLDVKRTMKCSSEMRELLTKAVIAYAARERRLHRKSNMGDYTNVTYTHSVEALLEYMGVTPNSNIEHAIFTHYSKYMNDTIAYFDLAWGSPTIGSLRHIELYDLVNSYADKLANFVRVNQPVLLNEGESDEQTVYPIFPIDMTHFMSALTLSNEPTFTPIPGSETNLFQID